VRPRQKHFQPSKPASDERPLPSKDSRQRPGETWKEFFARQAQHEYRRLANASAAQLKSWASRQENSKKYNIPGKDGPVVFAWQEDLDYPGFLYRKRVERKHVESVWMDFSDSQRLFNKFWNEWDLCVEFDPNGVSTRDIEDDFFHGPYVDPSGPPPPSPPSSSAPASPHHSDFVRDLEDTYGDDSHEHTAIPSTPLEISLRDHYGFLWDNEPYPNAPMLEWEKAISYLLHHNAVISSQDLRNAICNFVYHRMNKQAAPPSLWDLSMYTTKNPLHSCYDRRISVQTVHKNDQQTFYILRTIPASSNSPWLLVLQHAAAVLECLRYRWGPGDLSPMDIAKYLYQQGMAFSIRQQLSSPPNTQHQDEPFEPLGWRSHDHKFTLIDYKSYLRRRNDFCKQPYARAALETPGIVGRLVRESIGQDIALLGPALEDGHVHSLSVGTAELWGDHLTDKDLDLICGVYKVEQNSGTFPLYSGQVFSDIMCCRAP
jgi:hypothetical protein